MAKVPTIQHSDHIVASSWQRESVKEECSIAVIICTIVGIILEQRNRDLGVFE